MVVIAKYEDCLIVGSEMLTSKDSMKESAGHGRALHGHSRSFLSADNTPARWPPVHPALCVCVVDRISVLLPCPLRVQ